MEKKLVQPITIEELEKSLEKKKETSPGPDGITKEILKFLLEADEKTIQNLNGTTTP